KVVVNRWHPMPLYTQVLTTRRAGANNDLDAELDRAAERLYRKIGYPMAHVMGQRLTIVHGIKSALRDVIRRSLSLATNRLESGDIDGGVEVLQTLRKIVDRMNRHSGHSLIDDLLCAGYSKLIARTATENLPSSHTKSWLDYQELRVEAEVFEERMHGLSGDKDLVIVSYLPTLAAVDRALTDGKWPAWKLHRLRNHQTADEVERTRSLLDDTMELCSQVRARHLLIPGIRQQDALLPDLRAFRDVELDETSLYFLIWSLAELRDSESVDWLIEQLDDDREWLRLTAADSLSKITSQNHGPDAAEWRRALNRQP
ncbi:MAG: HEAT repeat domain-containing protein, partial [Phycisphaerae bacterium]|nr:HEAT repeat domain-containing protein [Phycisphaerae bacterium]